MQASFVILTVCCLHLASSAPRLDAVLYGIIGHNTTVMKQVGSIPVSQNTPNGCQWRGTAPFCNGNCEHDEYHLRQTDESSDFTFGHFCLTGTKAYCCRANYADNTWAGVWQSSSTGELIHCDFYAKNRCGILNCAHIDKEKELIEIGGPYCNQISYDGKEGKASRGLISWTNPIVDEDDSNVKDYWFKFL